MRTGAAVLLGLAALTVATGSRAAPRAESALECGIAADMAVVAHSLAHEQIQRQKAETIRKSSTRPTSLPVRRRMAADRSSRRASTPPA